MLSMEDAIMREPMSTKDLVERATFAGGVLYVDKVLLVEKARARVETARAKVSLLDNLETKAMRSQEYYTVMARKAFQVYEASNFRDKEALACNTLFETTAARREVELREIRKRLYSARYALKRAQRKLAALKGEGDSDE